MPVCRRRLLRRSDRLHSIRRPRPLWRGCCSARLHSHRLSSRLTAAREPAQVFHLHSADTNSTAMASAAATAVDSDEYDDADLWETPLPVPRTALDTVHPPIDPDVLAAAVGAVPPPLYDANHVAAPFLAVLRDDMPHAEAAAHLVGDVEDYLQRWGLSLCTQIADLVYASDACDTLAPFMQELPRAMLWYLVAICDPFEQLGAALEDVCNVHDAKHRERGRCALCHRFWPRVLLTYEALRRGNNCVVRERHVPAYLC